MIPSALPSFEVLVTLLMGGLLSSSLAPQQRMANFVATRRARIPRLLPDQIRDRIAKAIAETGVPPAIEMLCAELPHAADKIREWASQAGVHGAEFLQVVEWSIEFERRSILIKGLQVIGDELQAGTGSTKIVTLLHKAISAVSSGRAIGSSQGFDLREWYERKEVGPMWYIEPLDWIVRGMVAGSLAIIGGFTGSLKTTFSINVLYNNVVELAYNAVFFSLEMTRAQVIIRLLVLHAQHQRFRKESMDITVSKLLKRDLSESERVFLQEVVAPDLFNNPAHGRFFIREAADLRELTLEAIEEDISEVSSECQAQGGVNVAFIDYLQMLGRAIGNGRAADGYYKSGEVARWAKNLALGFQGRGLTVFLLAQFSRAKHNEAVGNDGLYDLSAFAESAEIERAADYAVSIYYGGEERASEQAKMQLLKNRHGQTIEEPFQVLADPDHVWVGDFRDGTESETILAELLADEPDFI